MNYLPCDLIPFVEKQDCYRRHSQWSWWHRPRSCNQNQINKVTQPQRWWACLKSTPRPSTVCCPPADIRRALIGDHPLPASHPLDCVKTNLQSLLLMSIWGNFQTPFENRPPPLEPWHCTELRGARQGQALQERGWRGDRRVPSWRWTVLMMLLMLWRGGGGILGLLGSSLFEQIRPVCGLYLPRSDTSPTTLSWATALEDKQNIMRKAKQCQKLGKNCLLSLQSPRDPYICRKSPNNIAIFQCLYQSAHKKWILFYFLPFSSYKVQLLALVKALILNEIFWHLPK